jgi:hypothetical protein
MSAMPPIATKNGEPLKRRRANGNNFSNRFPQIVAALTVLPVRSCLIDGEAVVCNERGLAVFDLIRGYRHDAAAVLCAFDLLELDGEDLRRTPIEERKRILVELLSHPHEGIAFNEHYTGDGAIIFKHACALGCEGIVSKRLGSSYRSGRADCWIRSRGRRGLGLGMASPRRIATAIARWPDARPLQERGQDDGRQNRQIKPEAEDCEGSGGGKQGDSRQDQEKHRLEVSRDGHDPLHCEDVRREAGLEPKMRPSHRAFIQVQPPLRPR